MENNKTVSQRLAELIEKEGVSYRELEVLTGISFCTIRRYATGETDKVPLEAIKTLSKALNVSPEYLIWGDKSKEDEWTDTMTEKTRDLIHLIKGMDEEGLEKLIQIAKLL